MKFIIKSFFIALFLTNLLFGVSAKVNKKVAYIGDSVTLKLSAKGKDIVFPDIKDVAGYKIESISSGQQVTYVNGKFNKEISKSIVFTPLKSITVPSYEVEVDGKIEKTKPISLVIKKRPEGKIEPFTLEMKTNKKEAYVGEPIELTVIFKRSLEENVVDVRFEPSKFDGFWVKQQQKQTKSFEGDYEVHTLKYTLFPQQSGHFNIEPAKINVGIQRKTRDMLEMFARRIKWRGVFSNSLEFEISSLPEGLNIYGDFNIETVADKKKLKAGEPLNFTIKINGKGNIDDIEDFDLNIPGAMVYADKGKRSSFIENGRHKGTFTQKFAIISDQNYTIPSLGFKFFDEATKSKKALATKSFDIEVTGSIQKSKAVIEKATPQKTAKLKNAVQKEPVGILENILYLIAGFFIGIISLAVFRFFRYRKKDKETSLQMKIKKAKDDKKLLSILLPYNKKSKEITKTIEMLEENIYLRKSHKIDKKDLQKNIDQYILGKNDDIYTEDDL